MGLFVSFHHTSRSGDLYDSGFSWVVLEGVEAPTSVDDIEEIAGMAADLHKEMVGWDQTVIQVLNWKELPDA